MQTYDMLDAIYQHSLSTVFDDHYRSSTATLTATKKAQQSTQFYHFRQVIIQRAFQEDPIELLTDMGYEFILPDTLERLEFVLNSSSLGLTASTFQDTELSDSQFLFALARCLGLDLQLCSQCIRWKEKLIL